MNRRGSLIWLSAGLVALSAVLYLALYAAFGRLGDIEFYTFLDIAFIPLQVLIVGLVINRLLAMREREALLHKLNMVIGAFFSEVGRELLGRLATFDTDAGRVCPHLRAKQTWTDRDFVEARKALASAEPVMDLAAGDAEALRAFLTEKRAFLLRLLENPNMLEHDRFTDTLWAVTHLAEELSFRGGLSDLPRPDVAHLDLDMRRAYVALLTEWLAYMQHLKHSYPYLYSLAVRTNPLDPEASVTVTQ